MDKNKLDIVICSASRPQLLPYCIDSIRKFIMLPSQNTDFRIIVHEDFVIPKESEKVVKWCEKNGIDKILTARSDGRGYGKALHNVLNNHVKTEYILNMQDDFEFERTGIDMDRIIWTMKKYDLWSIIFNKVANDEWTRDHLSKEFDFNGMKLLLAKVWRATPSMWKTSVAKQHWPAIERPAFPFIRSFFTKGKAPEQKKDVNYLVKNVRSYYFGSLNEPRWIRHMGSTKRIRKNVKNKAGKNLGSEVKILLKRPPWIPFNVRPIWGSMFNEGDFNLENLPKDVAKEFMKKIQKK